MSGGCSGAAATGERGQIVEQPASQPARRRDRQTEGLTLSSGVHITAECTQPVGISTSLQHFIFIFTFLSFSG